VANSPFFLHHPVAAKFMFFVRRKMSARVSELEEAAEQARSRAGKLEKERNRLQVEIHEVVSELEEVIAYSVCLYSVTTF